MKYPHFGVRLRQSFQQMFRRSPDELMISSTASGVSRPVQGPDVGDWKPTHRHAKGGEYRVLMHATLEADRSPAVIYDDADGTVWVRVLSEFYDGRFSTIEGVDFQSPDA